MGVQPHTPGVPPPPQVFPMPVPLHPQLSVPPHPLLKLPHLPAYCGELQVSAVQHMLLKHDWPPGQHE